MNLNKNIPHLVFLSLGSNLGSRMLSLQKALQLLREKAGTVTAISAFYETEAWGKQDQPPFINVCAALQTELSAAELLLLIKDIEKQLGRVRVDKWGSRIIDIDILLYDQCIIDSADLQIPHPYMLTRNFVMAPLAEIAAEVLHPQENKSIKDLSLKTKDNNQVLKIIYEHESG